MNKILEQRKVETTKNLNVFIDSIKTLRFLLYLQVNDTLPNSAN